MQDVDSDHPAVKFAHETTAGMVSIAVFESFHYFVISPIAAVLGVAATVLAVYHLKKQAGMHG